MKRKIAALAAVLLLCANIFPGSAGAAYEHDRNLITDDLEEMTYQFFLDHFEDFAQGKTVPMEVVFYNETEEEDMAQWNQYKRVTFFRAFEDFDNDHPENFFAAFKMTNIHGRVGSGGAWIESFDVYPHISLNWRPVEDGGLGWDLWADYQFLKNKVEELAAECRAAGPSRYDQLLYLHDWLIMNNAYNKPCYDAEMAYGETGEEWPDVTPHVSLSALRPDLSPVCDGYAFAFKLMCNALDIPCIATPGVGFVTMPDGSLGMHRWNYVQMEDGKWYLVDVTWDDPIAPGDWSRVVSGHERHTYFLKGEDGIVSKSYPTNLHESNDYYPVVSGPDYDPSTAPQTAFTDVPGGEYYAAPVRWAVEGGITNGTSASTFSPHDTCVRAQIVTFLYRAAGKPPVSGSYDISDVSENDYFYDAVQWAREKGLFEGDTFEPYAPCSRDMTMDFFWKFKGSPAVNGESPFTDTESSINPSAILWAVQNGITTGTTDTTFSPESTCTRAQIVTFLYRMLVEPLAVNN